MTWQTSPPASLLKHLKRLPTDVVPALYPVVLTLAGLAIAESYELIPSGSLSHLAQDSSQITQRIWNGAIALNHHYENPIPQHWLDSFPDGEVVAYEEHIRAIAQALAHDLFDHSLNAEGLGMVHECLMAETPNHLANALTNQKGNDVGQGIPGRKSQGAYYTPPTVVAYMVEQTVEPALRGAIAPRILDPACGGGIFLLGTYRYLLGNQEKEKGRSLSLAERTEILQHSITGVDLDSHAVQVTRLSLHLELLRKAENGREFSQSCSTAIRDILTTTIQQGNAIIDDGESGISWKNAFPTAMASGGFDVVLGNPPYLDSEGMTLWMPHWRHYCTQHYTAAQGNWDLFCVFIEKALALCKPGGYHSFIVPNKLASAPYGAAVRSLLLTQGTLLSIRDYSQASVFAASVYPLVYVVQRRCPKESTSPTPPNHPEGTSLPSTSSSPAPIRYERMSADGNPAISGWLPPVQFSTPDIGWVLDTNRDATAILLHLCESFLPLEELAQVQGAATVADAYTLQPLIFNDLNRGQLTSTPRRGAKRCAHAFPPTHLCNLSASKGHHTYKTEDDGVPFQFINSGIINRYCSLWGIKPLRYLGYTYENPVVDRQALHTTLPRRYDQAIAPKLIVAGMTKRLECMVDANGTVLAGKSTSIIRSQHLPLLYLLGILNSELIHRIVLLRYGSNSLQGGYLRIGPPQLRSLPIAPPSGDLGDRLIDQVTQMLELNKRANASSNLENRARLHHQIQIINHAIDQTVYALYQLSSTEIQVLMPPNFVPDTSSIF